MFKNKKLILSSIKYIYVILFSFHLLFKCINCDSHECRDSIYGGNYCCNGINSATTKYFYIYQYSEADGTCHLIDRCPDKVVAGTKECVIDCHNLNEVGDFCFYDFELDLDQYSLEINTANIKKYKCKEYTYIQLIDGKQYHTCIDDPVEHDTGVTNICPSYYYDIDNKTCVDSCQNKKIKKKKGKINAEDFVYYECRKECEVIDYEYNESIDISTSKNIFCLEQCPPKTPYFYRIPNLSPKCQKKCDKNHFYNEQKECFSSCDGTQLYLKENSNDFFYCFSETTVVEPESNGCPKTHPYKYNEKVCLKSCSDTQLNILQFDKITYSYIDTNDHNKKLCIEDCSENSYFADEDSFSCVQNCSNTKNKFHYNYKCVNSCTEKGFKFYTKTSIDPTSSSNVNDLECVNECRTPYLYNFTNICLQHCPKTSDKSYINKEEKECTSCKIPKNPLNLELEEGFLLYQDIVSSPNDITCYKSCPSDTYYKINDNICYIEIDENCYFSEDDIKICYPSCKEIKENTYFFSKKVEGKNICYKNANINCENEYYYKIDGFAKCIESKTVNINNFGPVDNYILECRKLNYYYLRDKECVSSCNDKEYIINPEQTIYYGVTELGKCCDYPDCDANYPYYSEADKILKKTCSLKLIEKNDPDNIIKSTQGNCVSSCPSDYPFESQDGKLCLLKCPYFYYKIGNIQKCIDNCKDINKFHFFGEDECIDECSKSGKNYYYDSDNVCYISCKDKEINLYALEAQNYPQKCLDICPDSNKYYFEYDNICLTSCPKNKGFYKSKDKDNKICVTQCEEPNRLIINDNICSNECTPEEPFIVSVSLPGSSIMVDKCISNCKSFNPKYKYYYSEENVNRCYEQCPPNAPYIINDKCVKNCPVGYFTDTESYECKTKCTTQFYIKNENEDEEGYKCVYNCDLTLYYISSSGECVKKCDISENFIGKNRRCKSFCEEEDGIYYKFIEDIKDGEELLYKIYLCLQSYGINSENNKVEYLVHETNEIVNKCPDNKPYLSNNGNICYSKCIYDESLPFSTEEEIGGEQVTKCSYECISNKKYYGEDKICLDSCDTFPFNKTINDEDNSCVEKCDLSSLYKFETKGSDGNMHCSKKCETEGFQKYSEKDYICRENCLAPYNYVDGKICREKCPNKKFAQFKSETNEYICQDKCDEHFYYYEKDRICIPNCEDYIIQNTNECILNCSAINYFFYDFFNTDEEVINGVHSYQHNTCVNKCPEDKPFLRENNHCFKDCNSETYHYYKEEDKKCLKDCRPEMKIYENKCVIDCPSNTFLDTKINECINSCENSKNRYYFYAPPNNECIEKCDVSLYINDYECVNKCPDDGNKYLDLNNRCVNKCPEYRNFVIKEFTHNEKDTQKRCLSSCDENYPYYYRGEDINECVAICSYYVLPENKNDKSIECFEDNCPDNYDYYIKYENGTNLCLKNCPEEMPYYIPSDGKKQCFESCPEDNPYFKYNSNECSATCDTKIIDYKTKECLIGCSSSQNFAKDGNDNTYCVDKCNKNIGEYLSLNKECVASCDEDQFLIKDISDPSNKKCVCNLLYYYDDSGNQKCFNPEMKECGEDPSFREYKYRIYNTNQCSKYCFGYLSPSEDICYLDEKNCTKIDINSILVINNQIKCECKYRFYIDKNTNKKICLGENEKCPGDYWLYNPNTKECTDICQNDSPFEFDNKCLKECPQNFETEERKCKCNNKWHKTSENDFHCYEQGKNCESNFPYLIEDTNECVNKCKGTNYEVFYKDKCYLSCSSNKGLFKVEVKDEKLKEIAKYTCQCQYLWYDDKEEIECLSSTETCSDKKFKYLIKDTNECTDACPESYYYFNNECFKTCDEAKNKYQIPVKNSTTSSKECICENLWKKEGNEVQCIKNSICDKFMVYETKECVEQCDGEYPLLFNNQCYKQGSCPEGTKMDIINGKVCICNNLWHKQNNNNIICLTENECPVTHPYKNFTTNECVKSCPSPYNKIVNNTCYNFCPDGTIEKIKQNDDGTETIECECDPQFGFWYVEGDEKPKMICELSQCPKGKSYYKNVTKECISSCKDIYLYEYNKICYENCPYPTISENFECTTKKYSTAKDLNESYTFLKEEIIELYKSIPKGGIVYNNFSSTLQIYGIKKDDTETKNVVLRSSLSYIDISFCLDKIYKNNKMQKNDEIIVVKYDLENQNKKSLVKPVEYEFINSRTGQILDMSVCTKDDVVVSYSLSDILNYNVKNKKRKLEDNEENGNDENNEIDEETENIILEIQNQYKKGKEIYLNYNMDTFNINSTIYNDMCYSFEVDGKDLVLEDRVKYLYPYYSLCEANCSYSYTDFELERIFCNCPLKSELDLKRERKFIVNPNNIDEIISKQNGPTNIPVLKCLSKLSENNKINKNGGFFYSLIIMIFEIGLLFITIFYNYKIFKNKIIKNIINNNNEEKEINIETIENGKREIKANYKNNDIIYKTSERNLDAPPKKAAKNKEIKLNDIKLEKKKDNEEINEKYEINNKDIDGTETEDPRINSEENSNNSFTKDYQLGILNEIKKEEKLLRIKYELAIQKDKSDIFIILLTEVCDKIYLFKILCLLPKYNMFSINISLYLLYHLLLLTFVTFFYDIKTIKKIWNTENYPDLNYDLGYGLLSCLIIWAIYRLFLCFLNNENIIKKFIKRNIFKNNNSDNDNFNENNKKFNKLLYKIKKGMIIYFVIELIFVLFCLLYLTAFCAIYTGTKNKIFKTYGIALVEVLIIKIIYGIILGIFRKVGLYKKKKILYKISYYFDKFIY